MSEFRIHYRDRGALLTLEVPTLSQALDDRERATFRAFAINAIESDPRVTVGELIDEFEQARPEQRRQLADAARERAGLETFTSLERQRESAERLRRPP